MRRIHLFIAAALLFVLFICPTSFSEDLSDPDKALPFSSRHGSEAGFKFFLGKTSFSDFNAPHGETFKDDTASVSFGGYFLLPLRERVSLQIETLISIKDVMHETVLMGEKYSFGAVSLGQLEFPVVIKYDLFYDMREDVKGSYRFSPYLGGRTSFLVWKNVHEDYDELESEISSFDYGIVLGADLSVNISTNWIFSTELRFDRGLTNIAGNYGWKSQVISLGIGLGRSF